MKPKIDPNSEYCPFCLQGARKMPDGNWERLEKKIKDRELQQIKHWRTCPNCIESKGGMAF